jgi:hypothetical protein
MAREQLTMLSGVGLGAALMYAFDHERGKRRRARLRDKLVSASNKAADAVSITAGDLRNHASGLYGSIASESGPASDNKLIARAAIEAGRFVSHPSAIEVTADQGRMRDRYRKLRNVLVAMKHRSAMSMLTFSSNFSLINIFGAREGNGFSPF